MADNGTARLSHRLLRGLRWFLIALGVFLILVVGSALILPRILPSAQIKALVVPRLESALGREVEVADAGLRVLPLPALRLTDFEVANAAGFGPEPAIEGDALDVKLELLPLFRGEVRFRAIDLQEPIIRYTVDAEGRSNFDDLGGAEDNASQTEMQPLAVTLSNLQAEDASLLYVDRQTNRSATVTFDLATAVVPVTDTEQLRSQGTLDVQSGQALLPEVSEDTLSVREAQIAYSLLADPNQERITVNRLDLESAALTAAVEGTITEVNTEPTVDLSVESDAVDLTQLSGLLASDPASDETLTGEASADLQVVGPATRPEQLSITGPIHLSEVSYPLASFREPVTIPSADVQLTGQAATVTDMPIQIGENHLELDLDVQDLDALFTDPTAGGTTPTAQFTLTSERIDLSTLYAETEETEISYADLVVAEVTGQQVEGQDPATLAAERYAALGLPPMNIEGQIAIDELLNPPLQYNNVSFHASASPEALAITDLTAEVYDGTASGEITVQLQPDEPPYPAEYTFSLENTTAEAFVGQWTSLGAFLSGTLDVSLSGQSAFGTDLLPRPLTLQANGSALATDGQFQDLALLESVLQQLEIDAGSLATFERFGGPFEIRDGRFIIPDWTLNADELNGTLAGGIGLDGNVDLDLTLDMPVALLEESGLLDDVGSVYHRLVGQTLDENEVVQVQLDIGGTMTEPRVQIGTEALEVALRQLIRDSGVSLQDFLPQQ